MSLKNEEIHRQYHKVIYFISLYATSLTIKGTIIKFIFTLVMQDELVCSGGTLHTICVCYSHSSLFNACRTLLLEQTKPEASLSYIIA